MYVTNPTDSGKSGGRDRPQAALIAAVETRLLDFEPGRSHLRPFAGGLFLSFFPPNGYAVKKAAALNCLFMQLACK
jgi:hypothetical protein